MGTGMEQAEITRHGFAILSGVRRDEDNYSVLAPPPDGASRRKGRLALMVEGAGDHPSLTDEVCAIALDTISRAYYEDNALSVTSSLLNAIETANSAVLEHCYAPQKNMAAGAEPSSKMAVQSGSARARGARVGLTAVLFRPDGSGVYLSQLAPTQAYIVHNGLVSALPEPKGWRAGHETDEGVGEPINFLPAQSLGSQPGLVADLTFRRMEPGDRVVLVSSSLARHIDREFADNLFFTPDAAAISEELLKLASANTLARATAQVLEIGGAATATATVTEAPRERKPLIAAPREWFDRKRTPAPEEALGQSDTDLAEESTYSAVSPAQEQPPPYLAAGQAAVEEEGAFEHYAAPIQREEVETEVSAKLPEEEDALFGNNPPTLTLLQPRIEAPPYLAAMRGESDQRPAEEYPEGWEDAPPILGNRPIAPLQRLQGWGEEGGKVTPEEWRELYTRTAASAEAVTPERQYRVLATPTSPPPQIFGDTDPWEEDMFAPEGQAVGGPLNIPGATHQPRQGAGSARAKLGAGTGRVLQWSKATLNGMLPEKGRDEGEAPSPVAAAASIPMRRRVSTVKRPSISLPDLSSIPGFDRLPALNLPRKPLIAAVVGGLVLLLILMIALGGRGGGSAGQSSTDFLQQAKQAELIANQPGGTEAIRRDGLMRARDLAAQALAASPESAEAKRLLAKIEGDLDRLDGVTRLAAPKLLFDLDAAKVTGQPAAVGDAQPAVGALPSSTGSLTDIVISSNDAYLLDKTNGQVFRCRLSTQACAPSLQKGDTVGGRTVSALVAMTQRVGNVIVLDDTLVAYTFNPDGDTWSAQPLGSAETLQKPVDLATYDGNLYLLGAKTGQIIKYASGAYGSPPSDWISDAGSVAQVNGPAALAIDGTVYVLLGDGRVLVMQGGRVTATLTPTSAAGNPVTDLFTSTDTRDLYLLHTTGNIVTRLSKEGQTLAILKAGEGISTLSGMTVDEGKNKLYLLDGRKVYEAFLPGRPVQSATSPASGTDTQADMPADVAPAGPPVRSMPTASP